MNQQERSRWLLKTIGTFETDEIQRRMSTFSGEEWAELVDLANRQCVSAYLFHRLKQRELIDVIPVSVKKDLYQQYQILFAVNTRLFHTLTNILNCLKENQIPVLTLKGSYFAEHVYDSIALRSMADIDLLVHLSDIDAVQEILENIGFVTVVSMNEHQLQFGKHINLTHPQTQVKVEPHFHITTARSSQTISIEELWQRSVSTTVASVSTRTLSLEDHFLHLCLHNTQHYYRLMNHLVDTHLLITRY